MSNWKDVGAGIMLWRPTIEVRIDNTSRTFPRAGIDYKRVEDGEYGSGHAASPDAVLPSIEDNLHAKQLIYEELFSSPAVTDPPAGYSRASSHTVAASPPSIEDQVVDHLKTSTPPSSTVLSEPAPDFLSSTPIGNTSSTASTETSYDSDRTDFLEHPETPCPTRVSHSNSKEQTKRATGRTSHYFRQTATSKREVSVRRQLDFGVLKALKTFSALKTPSKMVRAPEYGPNHAWTAEQDQILCLLWRWYNRQRRDYAGVFNAYFGLNLRFRIIDNRFFNYLRLHGAKAFRTFKAVFVDVPFNDPHGVFDEVRAKIDQTAASLGIKLGRLPEELYLLHGQARLAKSPKTRKLYKSLVRKAAAEERLEAVERTHRKTMIVAPPTFGRVAIHTEAEFDSSEYFTDDEEAPSSSFTASDTFHTSSAEQQAVPNLAFRVWDEGSRAKFDDEKGFVSEGFKLWKGCLSPPPQGEFIDLLLNNHMSMSSGGTSFWISVSTSLLQAFTKAANMSAPHIAIIALDHPTLEAPGKVLHAKQVLSRLKARGQAGWARGYKGWAEHLVFGRVERASIVHTLPLADLIDLFDRCSHVRSLTNLEVFTAKQRTMEISKQLQQRGTIVNASVGKAIAKLVLLMFGSHYTYGLHHIETFVCCVIESWVVLERSPEDTASASHAFVAALGAHYFTKKDLLGAFTRGMKQGVGTIEFFAKRRGKRRRTT